MSYVAQDGTVLTDELLNEIAGRFEKGELPGHPGRVIVGRPRISPEELKLVGVRVPSSLVASFDKKARDMGQTRSERLRALIEQDVAAAG